MKKLKPFLTASWQNLLMINYRIEPEILLPHVPPGTELDLWQGHCYVSLVAFHFVDTKVKGLAIPFHRDFEEVNLRFYVRRKEGETWKRGVVFIKEIVPKAAIAFVARTLYNENYVALPTRHSIELSAKSSNPHVCYEWQSNSNWNFLSAVPEGEKKPAEENSEEQFITEHYWGYSTQRDGGTVEYEVEHPSWKIWQLSDVDVKIDAGTYGAEFADIFVRKPSSAFLVDGSAVTVYDGKKIEHSLC